MNDKKKESEEPKKEALPPEIIEETVELRKKLGKLEGMMQTIIEQTKNDH